MSDLEEAINLAELLEDGRLRDVSITDETVRIPFPIWAHGDVHVYGCLVRRRSDSGYLIRQVDAPGAGTAFATRLALHNCLLLDPPGFYFGRVGRGHLMFTSNRLTYSDSQAGES